MNISNCSLKDECQFVKELKNKISNMKESYETDAEAKFYDYVDKYNSKKLLTANDYVELNKNNEILMIYNQTLLKENKELKKKLNKANDELYTLKNKYNIRLLNQISENIEPDCEDYYLAEIETKANKYDLIQTQQKEFIKYLEDEIKEEKDNLEKLCELCKIPKENNGAYKFAYSYIKKIEEILQKCKEIIGVSNDY